MRANWRVSNVVLAVAMAVGWVSSTVAQNACAEPSTRVATTRPVVAGRDTPAGAMTVLERAIELGDIATVADSFNFPDPYRRAVAREFIAEARFAKVMDARFGHDGTLSVAKECAIRLQPTDTKYSNDDWTISPAQADRAIGRVEGGKNSPSTQFMQRGPDGIWRIGRIFSTRLRPRPTTGPGMSRPFRTAFVDPRLARAESITSRLERVIPGIQSGQYASLDEVNHAIYPEGTPMAALRDSERQQKEANDQANKTQEEELLASHFDPSTIGGAIGAFTQALAKRDPIGMANFYFVPNEPSDKFALAYANEILAALDFQHAVTDHVDPNGAGLVSTFGFFDEGAIPSPMEQLHEHGDIAVSTTGGPRQPAVWYRKVGGVWKQEITLPPSHTIADRVEDLTEDTAAITQITAAIDHGKYKTVAEVRDAIGEASLNSFSDPTFTLDLQAGDETQPRPSERATPSGPAPTSPTTPAGAMNRFIRALQNFDEPTLRDSLYLPNDRDGAAASAAAHDHVIGMHYLRAVQKAYPQFDPNRLCQVSDVIGPDVLRDYRDDEWTILPQYPDLAVSDNVFVRKTSIANGRKSIEMQHPWTPMMHRGTDKIWRLGPCYPQNARQLSFEIKMLARKDEILSQATADLNANHVASIDDLANRVIPRLEEVGAQPVTTLTR